MKNRRSTPLHRLLCHSISGLVVLALVGGAASAQEIKLRKLSEEETERHFGKGDTKGLPKAPEGLEKIPAEAVRSESGVAYVVLEAGFGKEKPGPNDLVTIEYTGWLQDGRVFDTTAIAREPRSVQVNRAAEGLSDLFGEMVEGEFRRVWVPEELADRYRKPEIEGLVVFDIRLISIEKAPETPEVLAAPPEGAIVTKSGMSYQVLVQGRGEDSPTEKSLALAHVTSWDPDGTLTVSTHRSGGGPQSFEIEDMVEGFRESLLSMRVGEKRMIWMPRHLASLEGLPLAERKPQVVELELISFLDSPGDLDAELLTPPADAQRTESGLKYKVVRNGFGSVHPVAAGTVVVHYAVWSRDGSFVDSSFAQGRPYAIALSDKMPAGWNEAVQLMVEGERMRVWVPGELGFVNSNTLPKGPLVFDIDLVLIP